MYLSKTRELVEKFPTSDLSSLRSDLERPGLDHRQSSEILASFLAERGYGSNPQHLAAAARRIERGGCTVECVQAELERVALAM